METLKALFTKPRLMRLAAFGIDLCVFLLLLVISMNLFGKPDFITAQREMEKLQQSATVEEANAQAERAVDAFNEAYGLALWIWIGAEVLQQLALRGQTVGKKICRLRVVSNKADGPLKTALRMTIRPFIKVLLVYIFRGLPFVIALAYLFADPTNRTGYDRMSGTRVVTCGQT